MMADKAVTPWRIPFARDVRRFTWQSSSPCERKRAAGSESVFIASISRIGSRLELKEDFNNSEEGPANSEANGAKCISSLGEAQYGDVCASSLVNESKSSDLLLSNDNDPLVTFLEHQTSADEKRGEDGDAESVASTDGENTIDVTLESTDALSTTPCETSSPLRAKTPSREEAQVVYERLLIHRDYGSQDALRNCGETDGEYKIRTAARAVTFLSEALNATLAGNHDEFELLFPDSTVYQACDKILWFFSRQLTAPARNSAQDREKFASEVSRTTPSDHTSLSVSNSTPVALSSAIPCHPGTADATSIMTKRKSTRTPAVNPDNNDTRVAELRASIQRREDELAKLSQEAIKVAADPVKKATMKMEIKRVERLLLNDTLALAVHDSSGKFVNAITSRVETLESRQDAQDEDVKLNKSEMVAMKKRLVQLEEESKIAKVERRELLKLVDAVDNNSRKQKQSLVLHGLRSDEDARSLFSNLERHIDRVYQVGQPSNSIRGSRHTVIVHFDTVSRCDEAFEYLNSDGFDRFRSRIGYARNTSTLSRIGGSRMRVLGDRFVARYPGASVKRGYISYKNERYSAFDFAMQQITVDGDIVDIDEWIRSCEECEEKELTH